MATEAELEVFRVGELARDQEIVRTVGDRMADVWMSWSRFRDTEQLTRRSLALQTSPTTLNWAESALLGLGEPHAALTLYNQALPSSAPSVNARVKPPPSTTSAASTTASATPNKPSPSTTKPSPSRAPQATATAKPPPSTTSASPTTTSGDLQSPKNSATQTATPPTKTPPGPSTKAGPNDHRTGIA